MQSSEQPLLVKFDTKYLIPSSKYRSFIAYPFVPSRSLYMASLKSRTKHIFRLDPILDVHHGGGILK